MPNFSIIISSLHHVFFIFTTSEFVAIEFIAELEKAFVQAQDSHFQKDNLLVIKAAQIFFF